MLGIAIAVAVLIIVLSVVNGFESITGQINVELKKPDEGDRFYLNLYLIYLFSNLYQIHKKYSNLLCLKFFFSLNQRYIQYE